MDGDKPLIKFPTIAAVCAPFDSGKTSLVKYLLLQCIAQVACVVIHSQTGESGYAQNYSFVKECYVYSTWNKKIIEEIKKVGRRIKLANPNQYLVWFVDDFIGMTGNFFKSKKMKELITTLKYYNVVLLIGTHQLQTELTTLLRQNIKDMFCFQQTEPGGVKLLYNTFGRSSTNMSNQKNFETFIGTLPQYHFAYMNTTERLWKQGKVPFHEMPDFRIVLHPDDKFVTDKVLLYGNRKNINLSEVEKKEKSAKEVVDNAPMFREEPIEAPIETGNATEDGEMANENSDIENGVGESLEGDGDTLSDDEKNQFAETGTEANPDELDPLDALTEDLTEKPAAKRRKTSRYTIQPEEEDDLQGESEAEEVKEAEETEAPLIEQIGINKNQEELSKKDQVVKFRIVNTMKYISNAEGNPDKEMLDNQDPTFLQQNWDEMSFEDLKNSYRKFCAVKGIRNMIFGVENRYRMLNFAATEAIRTCFIDDPNVGVMVNEFFRNTKHEDVLAKLSKASPYSVRGEDLLDKFFTVAAPFGLFAYTAFKRSSFKQKADEKMNRPLTQEEYENYINGIDTA